MEVNGIISGTTSIQTQTASPAEPDVEEAPQQQPQSSDIPETIEQQEDESTEVPGVIRNLLDGHFKGVSDVRLRINHFEVLQAIEQEQVQAVIDDNAGALESIGQNLTELLDYTEDPAVSQETFEYIAPADVEEAPVSNGLTQKQEESAGDASEKINQLLISENQPKNALLTLVTNLQSTLTELVDSLNQPVLSTTNETPEMSAVSVDDGEGDTETPPADPPSAFEVLVTNFIEEFNSVYLEALDELAQSLSKIEVLPELSEPNGNGSAYEKFLATYNDLSGSGETNNYSLVLDSTV